MLVFLAFPPYIPCMHCISLFFISSFPSCSWHGYLVYSIVGAWCFQQPSLREGRPALHYTVGSHFGLVVSGNLLALCMLFSTAFGLLFIMFLDVHKRFFYHSLPPSLPCLFSVLHYCYRGGRCYSFSRFPLNILFRMTGPQG